VKPLIAFLFISFILGSTEIGRRLLRRPVILIAVCALFAASYYSIRVVQ
jgi:hypothetical protein